MELDKNIILATTLEKLSEKLRKNEVDTQILDKIYCILFEGFKNCVIENNQDILNYTFLGWWVCENLNNICDNNKNDE